MSRNSNYPGHFSELIPKRRINPDVYKHTILVDNRNALPGGNPFNFKVPLNCWLENVMEIKLMASLIPKCADEVYVLINLKEARGTDTMVETSNAINVSRAFAAMFFDISSLAPGVIKPMKGGDYGGWVARMSPPLEKLEYLTITVNKPDGSQLTLADTANVASAVFLFEVSTTHR